VIPKGKRYMVSTTKSFTVTVDPKTCVVKTRTRQTGTIIGGTGKFRHARANGHRRVTERGVVSRNPDESCSQGISPQALRRSGRAQTLASRWWDCPHVLEAVALSTLRKGGLA
jgi:hypothetical protein